MKKDLLKIINHYGIFPQLKHFHSEVFELTEALIDYKWMTIDEKCLDKTREHIAEEIADCYVMLEQFRQRFDITNKEMKEIMEYKIKRQLERMEENES